MTMALSWPFSRKRPEPAPAEFRPETHQVIDRTDRLAQAVESLGVETRAVAREAASVRQNNHFGPALTAAFMTPREPPK